MPARLTALVAEVFGVPEAVLDDASGPDSLPEWTSLAHLNLVLALEAEYGVTLTPEDAMDMLSVGLIRTILRERGRVPE